MYRRYFQLLEVEGVMRTPLYQGNLIQQEEMELHLFLEEVVEEQLHQHIQVQRGLTEQGVEGVITILPQVLVMTVWEYSHIYPKIIK